jgi:hypothetical protein
MVQAKFWIMPTLQAMRDRSAGADSLRTGKITGNF